MPIETFNISFECTKHKQQYDTKITCTELWEKSYGELKFDLKNWGFGWPDLELPLQVNHLSMLCFLGLQVGIRMSLK